MYNNLWVLDNEFFLQSDDMGTYIVIIKNYYYILE